MNSTKQVSDLRPLNTDTSTAWQEEETLILDNRAEMSPSQMVEQKLISMLKSSPLLVSHVQRRLKPGPR